MKRTASLLLLLIFLTLPLGATDDPFARYPYLSDAVSVPQQLADNQKAWLEETSLSLVSIGAGDPLHAWFGHSALILTQPSGSQIIYDWGIFDQSQEHFYLNFAQGRMHYFIYASDARWRIEEALAEDRDVRLVELVLPDTGKFAVIGYLQSFLQGGIGTYLYHFYDDNCATRIRDLIDLATDGAFASWAQAQPPVGTLRSLTEVYMRHRPFTAWVLNALQGPSIDQPISRWDAMALPLELEQAVHDFYSEELGTVVYEEVLQQAEQRNGQGRSPAVQTVVLALTLFATLQLLSLTAPTLKRILLGLLYLFLGALGSVLLFMMVASDMDMTFRNVNIIILNPLLFLAALRMFSRRAEGKSWLMTCFFLATASLVLLKPLIGQENLATLLVLLPLYLSGATFQRRSKIKERKGDEL